MQNASPTPAEHANLLRQQVILSQVRIMELEDSRSELLPRLSTLEKLLAESQRIADQKIAEAAHLEKVRGEIQAQYEHMRHMQHVTHTALTECRDQLTQTQHALAEAQKIQSDLLIQLGASNNQLTDATATLNVIRIEAQNLRSRIAELDAEQRAMKSSRSWRWTKWIRSIERVFSRRAL